MLYDPHLNLFLQVAELGSFSKAADAGFSTPFCYDLVFLR